MDQDNTSKISQRTERDQTDKSLRSERIETDTLALKLKVRQALADNIIERDRKQADKDLDAAREKADEKLNPNGPGGSEPNVVAREAVTQERVEEDVALKQERASADGNLRRERRDQARSLAALLPLVREKTDGYLKNERDLSDDAVEQREDFMSMISHELGNVLVGIAFHTKLLAMGVSDSDEGRRTLACVDFIERCVAHMNTLIEDLIDLASIEAGKFAVHPQPGNVAAMISEAITPFSHAALEKDISLEFANDGQTLPGVFDFGRMLQVLGNLITNAMRYTPCKGAITLKVAHTADELRVSVFDTGEGIPAEKREAIFERYGQAGGNGHKGLGLGLYISKYIVEAQGGRIWVESNPAGTGSAFYLTIPTRVGKGITDDGEARGK